MWLCTRLLLISFLAFQCLADSEVTITIPDGQIKGLQTQTRQNKIYYSFKGIPYAQPPIGDLRFKPPQPVQPWEGVKDVVDVETLCFQVTTNSDLESEDCLLINVYTPYVNNDTASLPVMVYIHGGGFVEGNAWVGEQFFLENDIVIASVKYRLGPFGFFSTGDSVIPGNNGLKDQHLALQWVQKNIKYFGGDPNQVTLFGQSAGGAAVSYHLLNPKSEGLFKAAICQSGSALSPWAYQRDQRSITFDTAALIDSRFAQSNNSTELLNYLLTVDARAIDAASATLSSQEKIWNQQITQGFYYAPVIEVENDDAFITERMFGLFEAGNFVKVPVMIGITAEEYAGWRDTVGMKWEMDEFTGNLSLFLPNDMNLRGEDPAAITAGGLVRDFYNIYTETQEFDQATEARATIYFSDTCFGRSVIKQAELQSKYVPIYFYIFSYDGIMGDYNGVLPGTGNVRHGEELHYIFNAVVADGTLDNTILSDFPEDDVTTHYRLVRLWSNFAKQNNPTPVKDELLQNLIWPQVNVVDNAPIEYLDINATLAIRQSPKGDMYAFWNSLYEQYAVKPYDSY